MRILPGDAYELSSPHPPAEARARLDAAARKGEWLCGHAAADGFALTLGPRPLEGLSGRFGTGLSTGFAPVRRVRITGTVHPAGAGSQVHVHLAPPWLVVGALGVVALLLVAYGIFLLTGVPAAWHDAGLWGLLRTVLVWALAWVLLFGGALAVAWASFVPEALRVREALRRVLDR